MRSVTASGAAVLALAITAASAQNVDSRGCLRLLGSAACPAFSYAYINPSNLTNAFPWMANVNSVQAFDAAVFQYLSNPDQWQTTKFEDQLGCTNATNAVIRWERTVLCSKWVNEQWSLSCTAYYNGSSAATSSKMVCQDTCLQYSASETQLVNSTTYCPGPDRTNGSRAYWLNKDFVDCTNWTTLATNNSQTCVEGASNEGNCGYGTSTAQLCAFCSGSNPDSCCYQSNTDVSVCGYTLPARTSSSSSLSPTAASSASAASSSAASASAAQAGNSNDYVGNTGLTKGQLAGTIIGSVLGGLLLLALLGFLIFFCCFRKSKRTQRADSASTYPAMSGSGAEGAAAGAGAAGMFGLYNGKNGAGGNNSSSGALGPNASEKGLLHSNAAANASSPTMGGDTLYSGRGIGSTGALSALSGGGAGAAAGAAGGSARPYSMSAASLGSGGGGGAGAGAAAGAAAGGAALGSAAGMFAGGAGKGERTSGNVLPRVRDENQGGNRWIETGSDVTVLWPYSASLPDELDLRPGMKLRVLRLYDDAWGTGQILSGADADEIGKQGAFPIVCVSEGSTLASGASSTDSH